MNISCKKFVGGTNILLPVLILLLLVALCANTGIGWALSAVESEGGVKGVSQILLNETYHDTFNKTLNEKVYILSITEPGIYLINANAVMSGIKATGRLSICAWAEFYRPWLDQDVSMKSEIWKTDLSLSTTEPEATKLEFITLMSGGSLIVRWKWDVRAETTVETNLKISKIAALTNALPITQQMNITRRFSTNILKFEISEEGLYNLTFSGAIRYNASLIDEKADIPIGIQVFDEVHGPKPDILCVKTEVDVTLLQDKNLQTENFSKSVLAYLRPGIYYILPDTIKAWEEDAVAFITFNASVSTINTLVIDTEGSSQISLNRTRRWTLLMLHMLPERYYNLSLTITSGGNWSVTATPVSVEALTISPWNYPIAFHTAIVIGNSIVYEQRMSAQNMVSIPAPLYLNGISYPLRDPMGYFPPLINYTILGEELNCTYDYRKGEFVRLLPYRFRMELLYPKILLNISITPIENFTPSEQVSINVSLTVTGNLPQVTPDSSIALDFNVTTGPTFTIVKTNLSAGNIYLVNITPTEYNKSGIVNASIWPRTYEDWWILEYHKNLPSKSAVNASVAFVIPPVLTNSTFFLLIATPPSPDKSDTSKVLLQISELPAQNYTPGTELHLSVENIETLASTAPQKLKNLILKFEVRENYTYVLTVKISANFSGANITIFDTRGNIPFKYQPYQDYLPYIQIPPDFEEYSWNLIAKENSTVVLLIWGSSGQLDLSITEIKSYQAGYQEGYAAGFHEGNKTGFQLGNETGFELGFETGNSSGYETGYEEGNKTGYTSGYQSGLGTGQIRGIIMGAPIGLATGVLLTYALTRRRTKS